MGLVKNLTDYRVTASKVAVPSEIEGVPQTETQWKCYDRGSRITTHAPAFEGYLCGVRLIEKEDSYAVRKLKKPGSQKWVFELIWKDSEGEVFTMDLNYKSYMTKSIMQQTGSIDLLGLLRVNISNYQGKAYGHVTNNGEKVVDKHSNYADEKDDTKEKIPQGSAGHLWYRDVLLKKIKDLVAKSMGAYPLPNTQTGEIANHPDNDPQIAEDQSAANDFQNPPDDDEADDLPF